MRSDRLVRNLALATGLQWVGASAILPLLPLYLRHNGGSAVLVGGVMSAFFAAGILFQYPAGHLADRFGHRPVLVAGLLLYSAASVAFLLPVPPAWYVALRGVQGAGAGAVQVASFALVALAVPAERRGRAFSALYGAQLAAMAVGPLVGSAAGIGAMGALFTATALTALLACVPVVAGTPPGLDAVAGRPHVRLPIGRAVVGVLLASIAAGAITGVYEACWSLLLDRRGAQAWQIGLSWTLFATPFAAMAPLAGRLADRLDRRVLVTVALATTCGFAATYPFLPQLWLVIGLGAIESIGVAVAYPAAQSLLSQAAPAEALGRAQGLASTTQTGAIAVAAAAGGALFAAAPWAPFVTAALVAGAITATLPFVWRTVEGRVTGDREATVAASLAAAGGSLAEPAAVPPSA
jgi:DHA1 family multidrug resistance protein-like MFS transporter